jgi:hypothetical protein
LTYPGRLKNDLRSKKADFTAKKEAAFLKGSDNDARVVLISKKIDVTLSNNKHVSS